MEQLIYLTKIIAFGAVLFLIFLKFCHPNEKLIHIIDAYFYFGIYHTVFFNYTVFITTVRLFFSGLTITVYYQFEFSFYMGSIYLILYLILLGNIIEKQIIGNFSFKKDFEYQKHCAPPHVIRIIWKSELTRRRAYACQVLKMEEIYTEKNSHVKFRSFLSEQFTYSDFNSAVNNSKSKKSIGQLFYINFKQSFLKTTEELKKELHTEKSTADVFQFKDIINFDENKEGLTINTVKVFREIDKLAYTDKLLQIEKGISSLQEQLDATQNEQNLSNGLKINISESQANKLVNTFCDLIFKKKSAKELSQMKYDFSLLINHILEKKNEKMPVIRHINDVDLNQVVLFFHLFHNSVFDFKLKGIITLLLYITNNNDQKISRYDKLHLRSKLNLDKKELEILKNSIPYNFRT